MYVAPPSPEYLQSMSPVCLQCGGAGRSENRRSDPCVLYLLLRSTTSSLSLSFSVFFLIWFIAANSQYKTIMIATKKGDIRDYEFNLIYSTTSKLQVFHKRGIKHNCGILRCISSSIGYLHI